MLGPLEILPKSPVVLTYFACETHDSAHYKDMRVTRSEGLSLN